jgi:hypothetical protein
MRRLVIAAVAVVATAGVSSAQGLVYKPIDTNQLVVQPTDAATNIFSGTLRYISRAVADAVDGNGYVKTLNNLLGFSSPPTATSQPGFSPLPLPGTYPSTGYKNSFVPAMPTYQVYGQSPVTK